MKRAMIVGGGKGGTALLGKLNGLDYMEVVGLADLNPEAEGMRIAQAHGLKTSRNAFTLYEELLPAPDIVFEATGDDSALTELQRHIGVQTAVVPAHVCHLLYQLLVGKDELITELSHQERLHYTVFQSTHDGMIAIDNNGKVLLFNQAAARMTEINREEAIGHLIHSVMPESKLPRILKTRTMESNQKQTFANGRQIVTTRIPLWINDNFVGALAVFQDVTDMVDMATKVTDLESVQQLLQAIIHSSDEAISVVNEDGQGLMINPAYSRLTGLNEQDVIGKPATADISEGESMHMRALHTRMPIRGTQMKVGPHKKDVIVNVAPLLVNGELKGSVGILHDVSEIRALTKELEKAKQRIRRLEAKYSFDDIIGSSPALAFAKEQAFKSAQTPVDVLLRGQSGTGKELFAHAIHNESGRRYHPFIRVNCSALSPALLESELFGYEEGAFTGAKRGGKRGLFEEAHDGSIFLDEIGEVPKETQVKLLRVLQEKEIVRVGGTTSIAVNVRIIAATNIHIEEAIRRGDFREDLFYRLNKMPIFIPSLQDRRGDIHELCHYLLHKINQTYGRSVLTITDQAMQQLLAYEWPGNVRELENILGRAVIHMNYPEQELTAEHLPPLSSEDRTYKPSLHEYGKQSGSLAERMAAYEQKELKAALAEHRGNKTAAARALGISVRNLYYKLEKHGIV
ncbi:sigma 54-interacting transcriptional regulator [Salicibibacter cibarius]|uniref:Sigma 54-interacting transcriptional regulator n=1 Tax=Salicibibacter cibarius TaxID=2743000 RepID=A0A7T6Z7J5_9BACI|nr:sigma-54-dependent Fis family transcriptional regulator [Salicibibacter cibarius]QQK78277.1 sigma 54-interacting transcriptional regulator [Salicibibacter cibarius]